MHPSFDPGDEAARLTLGGLHRSLVDAAGGDAAANIDIHFEQRSSVQALPAEQSEAPDLFVVRRFSAHVETIGSVVNSAEMTSGGISRNVHLRVILQKRENDYVYSTDGVHYGAFAGRPDLFDLRRFERRLDDVTVHDVTIEQVWREDNSVVVLDADLSVQAFQMLLAIFASDSELGDDLDLRSYSVAMSGGSDVALDYWWSLAGNEPGEGADAGYRHTVACHVQITVRPVREAQLVAAPMPSVLSLPTLHTVDEVWASARGGEGN